LTTHSTVFDVYFQCNHHHHHFWLALLTVSSATHSQQSPEQLVLSHAASEYCPGFSTVDDCQRLVAAIHRGIRSGFCSVDQSPLSELVEAADNQLFNNILCNKEHVLNSVLLSSIQLIYELWHRYHNRSMMKNVNTTTKISIRVFFIVCLLL